MGDDERGDGPSNSEADGPDSASDEPTLRVGRREALAYAGGLGVGLGGWKALDNVYFGYGLLGGTNLHEQDLSARVAERLRFHDTAVTAGAATVRTDGDGVAVYRDGEERDRIDLAEATREAARELDETHDLPGDPVTQLFEDAAAIRRASATNWGGDADATEATLSFEFSKTDAFFERVRDADVRPYTVTALRGPRFAGVDPTLVERFAGVDPADPAALVEGLARGFREYSSYDLDRYAAGAIEDNVLLGRGDLRERMDSPEDYEALLAGENDGLFCTELVERSLEAFHAVAAPAQNAPVAGAFVQDTRHKHAYTALVSVLREDGGLVVPVTFVDYTRSTLTDDLRLRGVLGEAVEAYDDRHRTTGIYWNRHPGV